MSMSYQEDPTRTSSDRRRTRETHTLHVAVVEGGGGEVETPGMTVHPDSPPFTNDDGPMSKDLLERTGKDLGSNARKMYDTETSDGESGDETQMLFPHSPNPESETKLQTRALVYLLLQHASSALGVGIYQFASFVFLVVPFKDTMAPASIIGLTSYCFAIMFSRTVGAWVDRSPRLCFVRTAVSVLKVTMIIVYVLFLVMFGPVSEYASAAFRGQGEPREIVIVWGLLILMIIFSTINNLANVGINVSVERDWVLTIVERDPKALTRLNSWMSTIDLLCKSFSAMVVAVLTYFLTYSQSTVFLIVFASISWLMEFYWLQVVYNTFPVLRIDEERRQEARARTMAANYDGELETQSERSQEETSKGLKREWRTWKGFLSMPVSLTTFAFAFTWLTSMHLDAIGVAYFEMTSEFSDSFIACMRALCMLSAFIGPWMHPTFERAFGTARGGAIALGIGMSCLICASTGFFLDSKTNKSSSEATTCALMMFCGIIVARAFHVTFDLSQLKILQIRLQHHAQRNEMIALQPAVCSLMTVCKFVMSLVFSTPDLYKWTTLITILANVSAMTCFLSYMFLTRKEAQIR